MTAGGLARASSRSGYGALQVRPLQKLDQGAQSEVAGVPADHRRKFLKRKPRTGLVQPQPPRSSGKRLRQLSGGRTVQRHKARHSPHRQHHAPTVPAHESTHGLRSFKLSLCIRRSTSSRSISPLCAVVDITVSPDLRIDSA